MFGVTLKKTDPQIRKRLSKTFFECLSLAFLVIQYWGFFILFVLVSP